MNNEEFNRILENKRFFQQQIHDLAAKISNAFPYSSRAVLPDSEWLKVKQMIVNMQTFAERLDDVGVYENLSYWDKSKLWLWGLWN